MHTLTIDLTEPTAAEAFADCEVGDTKILTVTAKDETSVTVDIEKGEYESDEAVAEVEAPIEEAPVTAAPPAKGMAKAY